MNEWIKRSPLIACDFPDGIPTRGCFGGGGDSGGGGGSTTTVQKADPWSGQQPYLTRGFQEAQRLYDTGGPQYFPGATYAPASGSQYAALELQGQLAQHGSPITGASNAAALNILDPNFLSSNPGNAIYANMANGDALQGSINNAVARATPGLLDTFTQGNRLNSPGAAYAVSQGITDAAAPIVLAGQQAGAQGLSQNYSQAVQQQNQANLIAPQTQGLAYNDLAKLYESGQTSQGLSQNEINDQIARYNYQQTEPYNLLNYYNSAIGGSYGGTSTLTSPYFQQQSGGLGGALGGAASGAALGTMIMPGWGTAIGAVGGGLLGGLF